jgi:hypothetical protein
MADSAGSPRTTPQPSQSAAIPVIAHVLVGLFLLFGALFLYDGLGLDFRIFDIPHLDPYGIPIGLLLFCLAALTAQVGIFGRKGND